MESLIVLIRRSQKLAVTVETGAGRRLRPSPKHQPRRFQPQRPLKVGTAWIQSSPLLGLVAACMIVARMESLIVLIRRSRQRAAIAVVALVKASWCNFSSA